MIVAISNQHYRNQMKERLVDVPTPSGAMETFMTHPQENAPFPAVIVFMDVWGVREELFDIARRIATVGYCCVVPDFYHRQGKVRHEFRDENLRMITLDRLDPDTQERVLAPTRKLSDAMVVDDTASLLEFLGHGEPVRAGPMGCIGYCMGGRHVFRAAANFPQRFRASVSLHGTNLVTERADSPHSPDSPTIFLSDAHCHPPASCHRRRGTKGAAR